MLGFYSEHNKTFTFLLFIPLGYFRFLHFRRNDEAGRLAGMKKKKKKRNIKGNVKKGAFIFRRYLQTKIGASM